MNLYRDNVLFATATPTRPELYFLYIGSRRRNQNNWIVEFVLPAGFQFSPF